MNEKQRIQVDGVHWNGIIQLPCFRSLERDALGYIALRVSADYVDEAPVHGYGRSWGVVANPGDWLVEYEDGVWGVERKPAQT